MFKTIPSALSSAFIRILFVVLGNSSIAAVNYSNVTTQYIVEVKIEAKVFTNGNLVTSYYIYPCVGPQSIIVINDSTYSPQPGVTNTTFYEVVEDSYMLLESKFTRSGNTTFSGLNYSASRADVENQLKSALDLPNLTTIDKKLLDYGCIGVAYVMLQRKTAQRPRYPEPYPESEVMLAGDGHKHAYLTLQDLLNDSAHACGSGTREVIFALQGAGWKNGAVPGYLDQVAKTVPLDSVVPTAGYVTVDGEQVPARIVNYVVKVNGQWINTNNGVYDGAGVQQYSILTTPPAEKALVDQPSGDFGAQIWIRACVKTDTAPF